VRGLINITGKVHRLSPPAQQGRWPATVLGCRPRQVSRFFVTLGRDFKWKEFVFIRYQDCARLYNSDWSISAIESNDFQALRGL